MHEQELLAERNGEELRTYREALERREDEQRQGQTKDDRHRQVTRKNFIHEWLFGICKWQCILSQCSMCTRIAYRALL